MTQATAQDLSVPVAAAQRYDAFISYSHAADGKLAPALQSSLHRFAKPWYRRRALHVFRDQTSLSATPSLWPTIQAALAESGHFLLLASPEAARSPWVQMEVQFWLEHKAPGTLLIALTGGTLAWDNEAGDFDWDQTDALPPNLRRAFAAEPLWVDLRWAKADTQLSPKDPRFQDAVADFAAPLHGRPKEDLVGEDVRQHRRAMWVAWGAVVALLLLVVALAVAADVAWMQRSDAVAAQQRAEEQARVATSRSLATQARAYLETAFDLSLLLSTQATRTTETSEATGSLLAGLLFSPRLSTFLHGHAEWVYSVAFSPDGQTLASGGVDGMVMLWDVARGLPRGEPLRGRREAVNSVAFSPDGQTLASGGVSGTITLWDVAGHRPRGEPLAGHAGGVASVAFSPDGQTLVSGGEDSTVILWDVPTGRPRGDALRAHTRVGPGLQAVRSVAFSPDGRTLASGGDDGTIILWDVATARPRGEPLRAHVGGVSSVAFSPDGRTLASGGQDRTASGEISGTVILRDIATGRPRGEPLAGHAGGLVSSVAFSPDGQTLASSSLDGAIRLWQVGLKWWQDHACRVANRNFTTMEWRQFVGEEVPYELTCPELAS